MSDANRERAIAALRKAHGCGFTEPEASWMPPPHHVQAVADAIDAAIEATREAIVKRIEDALGDIAPEFVAGVLDGFERARRARGVIS